MSRFWYLKYALMGGASVFALSSAALAENFDIPSGDLEAALSSYSVQTGIALIVSADEIKGIHTKGARGNLSPTVALADILGGTGFVAHRHSSGEIGVARDAETAKAPVHLAAAAAPRAPAPGAIETVVVTAQHKSENIQTVPIAVTALSQAQLTERQIAGGPDLVKEVPNLTFSKTNFTGYNLEIRGIGTQAISVTTDPAVAVAFNGTPFIRNHFFEQEFYDLQDVEVLRGPQGTLYGRNATAGVVNIKSALPTDDYEAMLSADIGNYSNRRLEAMLNLPIVGDKLDLRIAGEWTKRDGYSFDTITNQPIDGRDLWSGRVSLRWRPNSDLDVNLVWEHFQEDDDRLRSGKQLCKTDTPPTSLTAADGTIVAVRAGSLARGGALSLNADYLSQGCEASSLYAPDAFEVPYGFSLPYAVALGQTGVANTNLDPYASTTQSTNLRVIESALTPHYQAKNDTLEFNADYAITPALTFTSQTGYNQDFLWSAEDYNRFNTSPGIFECPSAQSGACSVTSAFVERFLPDPAAGTNGAPSDAVLYCDPQLGCSDRLVGEDLSEEHAWQLSQEFRLASNFSGPINFSVGGNYLHYETEENYYVFINALGAYSTLEGVNYPSQGVPNPGDNSNCLQSQSTAVGYQHSNPIKGGGEPTLTCFFVDDNPIGSLNNEGHNYFLSQNPYELNSYAGFGEAYYQATPALKFIGGLRWTEDQKRFFDIPSEVITVGYGYYPTRIVDQQWDALTGRAAVNWTPQLDFTDQTLVYGSYARGYKAGGANPPGAVFDTLVSTDLIQQPDHPLTFKPEFINAYELGSKNTLLDGALTLNGDIFYYDYKDYQISEIVDRTSINLNFNATVNGAEFETTWEPVPGLKFSFAGGYENTRIDNGQSAIDLMDRTAGMPGWMVVKPFVTEASNCILPIYVVAAMLEETTRNLVGGTTNPYGEEFACEQAYNAHLDPVTLEPYSANPSGVGGTGFPCGGQVSSCTFPIPAGYPGFNPNALVNGLSNNDGEGFAKNLGGNQLPNAPHFTTSLTAEYSLPVSPDWVATLHTDFYWQSQQWARVFNDNPYDKIHGYSNVNVSLILTSANGWQVMGYVKNVFNVTAITGDFLNSDDSGLTTNVFLTDPRLFGVRVTKQLDQNDGFWGSDYSGADFFTDLFADKDGGRPPLWIELGSQMESVIGQGAPFAPPFLAKYSNSVVLQHTTPVEAQAPAKSFGEEAKITYQPGDSDWVVTATMRIGRFGKYRNTDHQTNRVQPSKYVNNVPYVSPAGVKPVNTIEKFADTKVNRSESHAILDFMAGKDVGLGFFGQDLTTVLSAGVRFAQFASKETFDLRARPDLHIKYLPSKAAATRDVAPYWHTYHATGSSSRKFRGVGPTLSWTGSAPVLGDEPGGEIAVDWGGNAGILFGKQRTIVRHHESGHYVSPLAAPLHPTSHYALVYDHPPGGHNVSRSVAVPNLGGFAGLSYRYNNAKISFGYRADFFFGAIDGGIDKRKSETLNMGGPFATISFGLGG